MTPETSKDGKVDKKARQSKLMVSLYLIALDKLRVKSNHS